jgi:carboxymethylenebutenolidase
MMPRRLVTLLLLLASPAIAQDFAKAQLDASPRHHEWVDVASGERQVHCFVAYPEKSKNALAVIVIHENRGLTDWVRSFADQLAAQGYLAIAPDLLSDFDSAHARTSDFEDSDAAREAIYKLDADQVTADLLAVQGYVAKVPSANDKLVVAGFCWGGGQSFRFATNAKGLSAALVFYGVPPADSAAFTRIVAPVYGFYGGDDQRINATIGATQAHMKSLGKRYEPEVYDGAGHAYMRRGEEPEPTLANRKARDASWLRLTQILKGLEAEKK